MNMKYDFITIGGATRDISFFTDRGVLINNKKDVLQQKLLAFEYGAKIKVDKFYHSYGGGAANAAVCLANFSFKTACLVSVGKDESGSLIKNNLKLQGVETSLVKTFAKEDSGSSFILVTPDGERIIFGARGANQSLELSPKDSKILEKTKNIYLSSLSGSWFKLVKDIFLVVSKKKINIYWNPGGRQIEAGIKKMSQFFKQTTVLSLNKDEAIELVLTSEKYKNLSNQHLNNVKNLLEIIKSFGPRVVVITKGSGGVEVYDGQKYYSYNITKKEKRVDTTGVGDTFNASFAAGYFAYQDIDKAVILALENTAAKVAHLGAQNGLLKKKLIKKI